MLEARIPKTAKPHEVAILLLFEQLRSAKRVQHKLHYQHPQPVYTVLGKYRALFLSEGSEL